MLSWNVTEPINPLLKIKSWTVLLTSSTSVWIEIKDLVSSHLLFLQYLALDCHILSGDLFRHPSGTPFSVTNLIMNAFVRRSMTHSKFDQTRRCSALLDHVTKLFPCYPIHGCSRAFVHLYLYMYWAIQWQTLLWLKRSSLYWSQSLR